MPTLKVATGLHSADDLLDLFVFQMGEDIRVAGNLERSYEHLSIERHDTEAGTCWLLWGHEWVRADDPLRAYVLGAYTGWSSTGVVLRGDNLYGLPRGPEGAPRAIQVRYEVEGLQLEGL